MQELDIKRRYARHHILEGFGAAAQSKLLSAKVCVIGAGGLGSACLSYLAAAGVGTLGVVDADHVELSNLQRQILHEQADLGRMKVESAQDRLEELNPAITIVPHPVRIDAANAKNILEHYDIVADGCDNFETRFAVADACESLGIPLVSAAVQGWVGQLSTFKPYLGAGHPSYRCLVSDIPPEAKTCTEVGVLGPLCGVMGAWQAAETIKEICGVGESLSGTLIRMDIRTGEVKRSQLLRSAA